MDGYADSPFGTNPALLVSPIAGGDDVDAFGPLREPARLVPDFRFDTSASKILQARGSAHAPSSARCRCAERSQRSTAPR